MDHTPFIIGAYAITAVVMAWCALAPLIRLRRVRQQLLAGLARRTRAEAERADLRNRDNEAT